MAFSLFGNRQKKILESKQVQEIELDKIMPPIKFKVVFYSVYQLDADIS